MMYTYPNLNIINIVDNVKNETYCFNLNLDAERSRFLRFLAYHVTKRLDGWTWYQENGKHKYGIDFSLFNYSGNDIHMITKKTYYYTYVPEIHSVPMYYTEPETRRYTIYKNGVLFDIRNDKDLLQEIISFRKEMDNYDSSKDYTAEAKYGDKFYVSTYKSGYTSYRYRMDPVPYTHSYSHRRYRCWRKSRIHQILKIEADKEMKDFNRPGRYPKFACDFDDYRDNHSKSWKDCSKKKHQWER